MSNLPPPLTPEENLLLTLCTLTMNEQQKQETASLMREIKDWSRMVELINAHGIIALTAYNIREAGLENNVPGHAMEILDNGRMKSLVRNTWLTECWKEVNAILRDAGIKHILLKGMALEHTLYGAKGLRQMNDNDILVKREDSLRAWDLLQKNGFSPALIKSPLHKKIILDIGKHLPCLYKNGYAVEIHSRLPGINLTGKEVGTSSDPFDDAVEINVAGTKALMLSKEKQLSHLISHFNGHTMGGDRQLRLYTDIILLDKTAKPALPGTFLLRPMEGYKPENRKMVYRETVRSIPAKYRTRYLAGDIFPSLKWMKHRHRCGTLRAMLYYPRRIGKLMWLVDIKMLIP